jgi:hypothetical protein
MLNSTIDLAKKVDFLQIIEDNKEVKEISLGPLVLDEEVLIQYKKYQKLILE